MRWLTVFFLMLIIVPETNNMKMNPFNFRKRMLKQFNGARRILASGDIAKIVNVLRKSENEDFEKINFGRYLGPASDMYKMVWNRHLEQAGMEYIHKNPDHLEKFFDGTLHYKDYIGFHWMGDFWALIELAVPMIPSEKVKKYLKPWLEIIEMIAILLWMVISAIKKLPIREGVELGAAEALFASRFEIGCYSNVVFSVCFLKKMPFQDQMFTVGAACSKCEDRCEAIRNEEGIDEIGELCVPPKGFYAQQQTELKALESFASQNSCFLVITILIFFAMRKFV